MSVNSYPKVVKKTVNLGDLPYFERINAQAERSVQYHHDNWIKKFPRVLSLTRIADALEINLFLEHRFKGVFMPPKHGGKTNPLGGITLLTLNSIAISMCLFLEWIEENDVHWQEVYAVSDSDKAKYWLPVYRYRKYLINRIVDKEIDRDTGNLYINHVRQFYEWARMQRRIDKLPFKYKTKVIKKKRKDGDIDLLFTSYALKEKGILVTTSDLLIPKKYRQKKVSNSELSPYSKQELQYLYSTVELSKDGPRLRVDLACHCGLRAEEIATFPASLVKDPTLENKTLFYVEIVGKFGKLRTIMISRHLMQSLWQYVNSKEHQFRLSKWQMKHGSCEDAPLFMNRSGAKMLGKSIANVISKARKELKQNGIELKRDFHDLRATFATNLAGFMLDKHLPLGFIQYKLMELLGHSNFSTTQKYINFARSMTFDQQMASWVDKLFGEFLEPLQEDVLAAKGVNKDA